MDWLISTACETVWVILGLMVAELYVPIYIFSRNCFLRVLFTQLYGIKYSYQIEKICTQLYGFKYSSLSNNKIDTNSYCFKKTLLFSDYHLFALIWLVSYPGNLWNVIEHSDSSLFKEKEIKSIDVYWKCLILKENFYYELFFWRVLMNSCTIQMESLRQLIPTAAQSKA